MKCLLILFEQQLAGLGIVGSGLNYKRATAACALTNRLASLGVGFPLLNSRSGLHGLIIEMQTNYVFNWREARTAGERDSWQAGCLRHVLDKYINAPHGVWSVQELETLRMKTAVLLLALVALVRGQYSCYGDVTKIRPSGASVRTASQDDLSYSGVRASQRLVDSDVAELNMRKSCYVEAGQVNCVHPALIAAIASRESRGGKLLYKTKGWGDKGRAWGIMQCDKKASGLGSQCTTCGWDSCCHIEMMTRVVLVPAIKAVKAKLPSWTSEQVLQGGIAAYNYGVKNVQTVAGVDIGTTGDDYSNDVIARAQWLISKYGW